MIRVLGWTVLILIIQGCANGDSPDKENVAGPVSKTRSETVHTARRSERDKMVATQIEARGITDKSVLKAMRDVPRHVFTPQNAQRQAYADYPLSIGEGQTISQPYIVAFMTQSLALKPTHKVLEIGTGSGYQAAILAEIVKEVYTIEIVESLGKSAKKVLDQLGYKNIKTRIGDGYKGWPDEAPFDAIIVTAAPKKIPPPLIEQLKIGGLLVIPVGGWSQELVLVTKTADGSKRSSLLPVRFVPMTGKAEKK